VHLLTLQAGHTLFAPRVRVSPVPDRLDLRPRVISETDRGAFSFPDLEDTIASE
jgi:hypothetical protein